MISPRVCHLKCLCILLFYFYWAWPYLLLRGCSLWYACPKSTCNCTTWRNHASSQDHKIIGLALPPLLCVFECIVKREWELDRCQYHRSHRGPASLWDLAPFSSSAILPQTLGGMILCHMAWSYDSWVLHHLVPSLELYHMVRSYELLLMSLSTLPWCDPLPPYEKEIVRSHHVARSHDLFLVGLCTLSYGVQIASRRGAPRVRHLSHIRDRSHALFKPCINLGCPAIVILGGVRLCHMVQSCGSWDYEPFSLGLIFGVRNYSEGRAFKSLSCVSISLHLRLMGIFS